MLLAIFRNIYFAMSVNIATRSRLPKTFRKSLFMKENEKEKTPGCTKPIPYVPKVWNVKLHKADINDLFILITKWTKRGPFPPASGVFCHDDNWHASKLSLAFDVKKLSFRVPKRFHFYVIKFLCYHAAKLLHNRQV